MIDLRPTIDRINSLLSDDNTSSVTYAALEARLALERVVYDRLRQRHDYISHAQLKAWKPGDVVKRLLAEVDGHMTETVILSMARTPHDPGVRPEDDDYVQIGIEIGINAKKVAGMWQALSNLALHARVPENRNDDVHEYGDPKAIRAKVEQVVKELERLAKGTMTFSGVLDGGSVSFTCLCGESNKRRANLLRDGQHVFCINPKCKETWKVVFEGDEAVFENVVVEVPCKICRVVNNIPWRLVAEMKYDEIIRYPCYECRAENLVKWQLMQATLSPNAVDDD